MGGGGAAKGLVRGGEDICFSPKNIPMSFIRCNYSSKLLFLSIRNLHINQFCIIRSLKVTGLPPVWERGANSAYHLLFRCLLRYVCPSFSLMFRTNFGF